MHGRAHAEAAGDVAEDVGARQICQCSPRRSRIEQVITNLLGNAIKYAAGCPIHIGVFADHGEAVIEVSDRGPGLPSQDAPIFGRFERAASMRNYGGLGLGLYIVQQIAEAHGGSVAACNAPEGGARFLVRLPRKESN